MFVLQWSAIFLAAATTLCPAWRRFTVGLLIIGYGAACTGGALGLRRWGHWYCWYWPHGRQHRNVGHWCAAAAICYSSALHSD